MAEPTEQSPAPRRRRWLRRMVMVAVVGLVLLLGGALLALLFAPEIGTRVTHKVLRTIGFEHVEAKVVALTPQTLVVSDVVLGEPENRIAVDRMVVHYQRNFLFTKRIEWIDLHGVRFHLLQTAGGEWRIRGLETFYGDDSGEGSDWMVGKIRAYGSTLVLHYGDRRIPMPFEGTFTFADDGSYDLELQITPGRCRTLVEMSFALEPLDLAATVTLDGWELDALRPLLGANGPEWLQGQLSGTVELRSRPEAPLRATAELSGRRLLARMTMPASADDPATTATWQAEVAAVTAAWSGDTKELAVDVGLTGHALDLRREDGELTLHQQAKAVTLNATTSTAEPLGEALRAELVMERPRGRVALPASSVVMRQEAARLEAALRGQGGGELRHRIALMGTTFTGEGLGGTGELTAEGSLLQGGMVPGPQRLRLTGFDGHWQETHWSGGSAEAAWSEGSLVVDLELDQLRQLRDGEPLATAGPLTVQARGRPDDFELAVEAHADAVAFTAAPVSATITDLTLSGGWKVLRLNVELAVGGIEAAYSPEGLPGTTGSGRDWRLGGIWWPMQNGVLLTVDQAPLQIKHESYAVSLRPSAARATMNSRGELGNWSVDAQLSASVAGEPVVDVPFSAKGTDALVTLSVAELETAVWTAGSARNLELSARQAEGAWKLRGSSRLRLAPEALLPHLRPVTDEPLQLLVTVDGRLPVDGTVPDWATAYATLDLRLPARELEVQAGDVRVQARTELAALVSILPSTIALQSSELILTELSAAADGLSWSRGSAELQIQHLSLPLAAGYGRGSLIPMHNPDWLRRNLLVDGYLSLIGDARVEDARVPGLDLSVPLRWRGGDSFGEVAMEGRLESGPVVWQGLKLKPLELPLTLRERRIASRGTIALADVDLQAQIAPTVSLSAAGALRVHAPYSSTIADLATLQPILERFGGETAAGLVLGGQGELSGLVTWGRRGLGGGAELTLRDASVQHADLSLDVSGLTADVAIISYAPLASASHQTLSFGPSNLFGYPTMGGEVAFQIERDGSFFLESAELQWLGGQLRSYAARIAPETTDVDLTLFAENVELQQLLDLQDVVEGTATGELFGKFILSLKNGRLQQTGGYLFNPPNQRGNLHLTNAEALLSQVGGGSDERVDMARRALQNFNYELVRLDMQIGADREAQVVIKLHGKSATNELLPPVHVNTTITGPLQKLIDYGLLLHMKGMKLE